VAVALAVAGAPVGTAQAAQRPTSTPATVAAHYWQGSHSIALDVKDHDTAGALSSANVVCGLLSPPIARSWIADAKVSDPGYHGQWSCPVAIAYEDTITHQSPSEFAGWQHVKTLHQTATTAVCELENPSWGNPTVHLGLYSGTWLVGQSKGNG
jgi:hypothetical protein